MKTELFNHLNLLKLISLHDVGRAANIVWFQFGDLSTKIVRGKPRTVAAYALHLQCPWRIIYNRKIILGSADMYRPNSHYQEDRSSFNWDEPGENALDEKLEAFIFDKINWNVESIKVDDYGGFILYFSNGYQLETFPNETSDDGELWRLLMRDEQQHFVVSRNEVELI